MNVLPADWGAGDAFSLSGHYVVEWCRPCGTCSSLSLSFFFLPRQHFERRIGWWYIQSDVSGSGILAALAGQPRAAVLTRFPFDSCGFLKRFRRVRWGLVRSFCRSLIWRWLLRGGLWSGFRDRKSTRLNS